jgi:hypothetical protein
MTINAPTITINELHTTASSSPYASHVTALETCRICSTVRPFPSAYLIFAQEDAGA